MKAGEWKPWEWGHPNPNVDASYLSLKKYNKAQPYLELEAFEKSIKWMRRTFERFVTNTESITFEEALCYVERTSSPGYPWEHLGKNGDILGDATKLTLIRDAVEKIETSEIDVVWKNSLKEEIRPMEKLRLNKIRTFTAAPLHFTIYCIMHCSGFNNRLFKTALQHPSVVGFDTYKGGWHELYKRLKKHSNAFELDVSEYDSSIFRALLFAIAEMRADCSTNPNSLHIFRRMYQEIVNSLIMTIDGNFVNKSTGNPSGSYNTIVDNTLALYALFCYSFILSNPEKTYQDFVQNVEPLLCGDDNSFTVSDSLVDSFNAKVIRDELNKVGVNVTSPDWEPRAVEEITFLSRSFDTFALGKCLPRLSQDKMLKSLEWTEYPGDPARVLERVSGFLNVAWPDMEFYRYLRRLEKFLYDRYDSVMAHDAVWVCAKAGILTEREHQKLFLGEKGNPIFLRWELGKDIMPIKKGKYIYCEMENQAAKGGVVVEVRPNGTISGARKKRMQKNAAKRAARKAAKKEAKKEYRKARERIAGPKMHAAPVGAVRKSMAPQRLTKEARKVIMAIALPQNSPGLRISSGYNDIPTAVDSIYERESIVYGAEAETFAFAFRSALRNAVRGILLLSTEYTAYGGYDTILWVGGNTWQPVRPRALYGSDGRANSGVGTRTQPHGPYLYPGRLGTSDPNRGWWVNPNDVVVVYTDNVTAYPANTVFFRILYLRGEVWVPYEKPILLNAQGYGSLQVTENIIGNELGTYVAVEVSCSAALGTPGLGGNEVSLFVLGGTNVVDITMPSGTFPFNPSASFCTAHRPLKDLERHFQQINNLKIYGQSILYTQTSAFTSNQGQVAMAQYEGHKPFWENYEYKDVSSVNPARGKYMPVTNGSYCFLKPNGKENFDWLGEFEVATSSRRITEASGPAGLEDGAFQIYPDSDYLALVLNQDPAVTRTGLITVASTLEYITDDQWVEVKTPNLENSLAEAAISSIRHLPQFHENEFHISDVFNWLKEKAAMVVNGVLEYGPAVLRTAALAAPFLI